jgi:hypothetical protein
VFGRLAGLENSANAVGYGMLAFIGIVVGLAITFQGLFLIAALATVIVGAAFLVFFREPPVPAQGEVVRLDLRSVFRFDLNRKLYIVIGAQTLFNVGSANRSAPRKIDADGISGRDRSKYHPKRLTL